MSEVVEKPKKPQPNECCGGGSCCPCVWDAYYEKLSKWEAQNSEKPIDSPSLKQQTSEQQPVENEKAIWR